MTTKQTHNNKKKQKPEIDRQKQALGHMRILFLLSFAGLIVYLIYFMLFQADNLLINTYNPRLAQLESNIIRGKILDNDGEILVDTLVAEHGSMNREYPYGSAFAHVLGYSQQGKTGLEATSDMAMLRSNMSISQKIYFDLTKQKKYGDNVVTTLDLDLQLKADEILGGYKGAIVALEPSTGKILCMVSKPDFQPAEVAVNWENLISDEDNTPLINRATQGLYPPGSTFKILTAIEYLKENPQNNFFYSCSGEDTFGDKVIHCYNSTAHGDEDLTGAFADSCNTAFATIGKDLDIGGLADLADAFLFNQALPYALMASESSFILTEQDGAPMRAETVIGQGQTLVTPLHNAMIAATIANSGAMMRPYVIDHMENNEGRVFDKTMPETYTEVITPEMSAQLTALMTAVIDGGTGSGAASSYTIAGKTGSAENPFGDDHAWFVGFAPAEDPKIAIAILVENGGSSASTAVPMAKSLLDAYLVP